MERRALLGLAVVATAAASTSASTPARASSSGGAAAVSPDSYFRLPVITASILHPDGRRGVFSVEAGVDVPDAALRTRAQQSTPRLRAAYTTAVQRFANGLRSGVVPNIDQLANDLQAATNTTLGRPGARILLGTVMAL
ncbi:Tat pathway signal protein [Brevundimonas sp.]|uniref:Tat pathway signal protein n=1 Tax=Brevundimonas sp. TaxID=1871086 RepID=UPI0018331FE1|nr:Tat pathway signal protein [Brevundimonas sp.]MBA4807228.1 Tat pathway signal protein [Brevundimonas sp.]